MGLLDELGSMTGQMGQGNDQSKVAGGLMQALEQHPGGVQGMIDSFRQNGMGDHVDGMANGQVQTTTPEQVQQGLNGTGLIERTAEHAGVSPAVVTMAMSTVLPMVIQHFTANGQQPGGLGQGGGFAQQILSRFL